MLEASLLANPKCECREKSLADGQFIRHALLNISYLCVFSF